MTKPKRPNRSGTPARTSRGGGPKSTPGTTKGNAARPGGTDTTAAKTTSRRPSGGRRPPSREAPQLGAPPPDTVFKDRDGKSVTFPESALKRVAARILSERGKAWRYRPFSFPLFTERSELDFNFDFYVYDNQNTIIRLILIVSRDSRDTWDRVGRFKRQYPMYEYELWTPDKLAELQRPRARLSF